MYLKQEYLKAIFDDAPIGLGIIQRGRIKFINKLGLRIFGYESEKEILEKRISSIILEDTYKKIKTLLKTPKSFPDILELKGRRKDGTPFPFRIDISHIKLDGSLAHVLYLTDLSEIRRTEKSWQESELRYFSLVNNSPSAIAIHSEGKIVYVNPAAIKMFNGSSADEFLGKKVTDFVHERYRKVVSQRIEKMIKNKNVPALEEKFIRLDGSIIDVVVQAAPVIFENHPAIQVVITDITEQKKNESVIIESEKSYRGLFNNASDAIYIQAKDGSFIDVNESVVTMYGYPRDFFVGKSPADLSAPGKNDLNALKKRLAKAYKGEPQTFYFWGKKKDRTVFPKEVRLNSGTYFGQKVIFAFARDISQRYQAEIALKKSEARFRTLIEKSPVPIGMSREGVLIFANDAYIKVFGYDSTQEIIGKPFVAVVAQAQRDIISKRNRKRESGQDVATTYESVGLRKDGSTFPFLADISLINLDDGPATLFFLKDLSEIKKAESEKLDFERQLLHAQKLESLGVLAGGIAHDFNNILMSILGNAELAEHNLSADHPVRNSVLAIENAAKRAAELTNQMLAYSGRGKFVIKPVNLTKLVKEMTQMVKVSISKKINLVFDCPDELPLIEADIAQIQQVIINLITNASEAIGSNEGLIKVKTGVASEYIETNNHEKRVSKKYVFLEISDTGCGMNRKTKQKIFEPFFTTKFAGRGLGLSAVLGIINGHKGHIKIKTKPGQGSTFRILLPATAKPKAAVLLDKPAINQAIADKGFILVADDEESVLNVARIMFENMGFKVDTAEDGAAAIKKFKKDPQKYQLILLDLTMPKKDGEQVFFEIRKIKEDANIIITSGYSEHEISNRFRGGVDTYFLQKPFRISELTQKLNQILS